MSIRFVSYSADRSSSPLRKIATVVGATILAATTLMFSVVLLVVLAVVIVIGGGYWWWRTRAVRKLMSEQMQHMRDAQAGSADFGTDSFRDADSKGVIIEGEAVRVEESISPRLH